jgi:hypothetical protein
MKSEWSDRKTACAISSVAFAFLFWFYGNRFVPTNDEGILLEPARLMAQGARPYVDFFGYMSPGSYWIQAILFKLLGLFLWVGRLPTLIDLSLQCGMLFWLTAKLASRRAGWAALIVFAGFQIADPSFVTAQHRWDSGTLALAGLCVAVSASALPASFTRFAASGALLAAAAWCTPSMALVIVVTAAWMLFSSIRRKALIPFIGGVAAVTMAAVGWLAGHGALKAFVEQMIWLQKNYASVNVMPYGSVIGGYERLFEGTSGPEAALRVLLVACLVLPAILPPLSVALWGWLLKKSRSGSGSVAPGTWRAISLLLPAASALIATAFPRADVMHLSFVVALPYALVAAGFAHLLSVRSGAILSFTMIPFSLLFSLNGILPWFSTRPVETPAGRIRVASKDLPQFQELLSHVHAGDSLYVYPYMPIHYFVTQATNPTRFCYLNAGMMTKEDEAQVLTALQAHPPEWLLYMPLTREEFLRVFPNGGDYSNRFANVEDWIESQYRVTSVPSVNLSGYRLMKRKGGEFVSQAQR